MTGARHDDVELFNAVISALTTAGLLVGDAEKPVGGGWQGTPGQSTFRGYVDVWPIQGGWVDGSLADPNGDVQPDMQLTSVGATRAQAQTIARNARDALLAATFALTGRTVQLIRFDFPGGVARDDDAQPPVFYVPDRFRIFTTPTTVVA